MIKSQNIYGLPFPLDTKIELIVKENQAHAGPFKGAIDFAVKLQTPVLAPLDGEVLEVIDSNDKFGVTEKFAPYVNFITIKHADNEFSQLLHLEKGSSLIRAGDEVKKGEQIALSGNSGWMTGPHIHMFVFKLTSERKGFKGLEIRFEKR